MHREIDKGIFEMIRFTDYRKAKIISEAATQEEKLKMRRPTPMFPNGKKIKLDPNWKDFKPWLEKTFSILIRLLSESIIS